MVHYAGDIIRGGVTAEYSAEMWENFHKVLMKVPYRGSNYKNVEGQIMNHHAQSWSLNMLRDKFEDEESDEDDDNTQSEVIFFLVIFNTFHVNNALLIYVECTSHNLCPFATRKFPGKRQ